MTKRLERAAAFLQRCEIPDGTAEEWELALAMREKAQRVRCQLVAYLQAGIAPGLAAALLAAEIGAPNILVQFEERG